MWEIADQMTSWILCCNCWVLLDDFCHDAWVSVSCNSCHKWKKYEAYNWVYSESWIKKILDSWNTIEIAKIYAEYSLHLALIRNKNLLKNRKELIHFLAELIDTFSD